MQEGAEEVVVAQPKVELAGNQGETPLLKEIPFKRQHDLQAQLLTIAGGKFPDKPPSQEELRQKLGVGTRKRWDWKTFNKISLQERKETGATTIEEWKTKFKDWTTWVGENRRDDNYKQVLDEVLKKLEIAEGIAGINDTTLQSLLDNYAGNESKMDAFVVKILELPQLDKKIQVIQDIASRLFGKKVAPQICSQIVDLEQQIIGAGGDEGRLEALAETLSNAAQSPSDTTREFMSKAKELYEKSKEKEQGKQVSGETQEEEGEDGGKKIEMAAESVEHPPEMEVLSSVGHKEQQIEEDPHSVGGDYYLTYADVQPSEEIIRQRGQVYLVMDTATIGGRAEQTKKFAQFFLSHYYNQVEQFSDSQTQARMAFDKAKSEIGLIDSTFTYVIKKEGRVYSGGVGNSPAVLVRADGSSEYLVDPTGQARPAFRDTQTDAVYYLDAISDAQRTQFENDPGRYKGISDTKLIASGEPLRQRELDLAPDDLVILHTDGIKPQYYRKEALITLIEQLKAVTTKKDDSIVLIIK
jgi:hypothetical protein